MDHRMDGEIQSEGVEVLMGMETSGFGGPIQRWLGPSHPRFEDVHWFSATCIIKPVDLSVLAVERFREVVLVLHTVGWIVAAAMAAVVGMVVGMGVVVCDGGCDGGAINYFF